MYVFILQVVFGFYLFFIFLGLQARICIADCAEGSYTAQRRNHLLDNWSNLRLSAIKFH
jgi:hypothetical protein